MALRGAGEHDEAERVFADAVETARTRRQAEWLRYALFPWTRILLEEGRLVQAELCARELVESVEQATAPTTLLAARALLARVLLAAGNLDEAVGHAELAFRAIETRSDGRPALVAALDTAVGCATVLRAGGREEDAETLVGDGCHHPESAGDVHPGSDDQSWPAGASRQPCAHRRGVT